MKALLTIFLCFNACAQGLRVRSERIEAGSVITSHGTASVIGNHIVTAWHVVEVGSVEIETAEGWTKCRAEKLDADCDLAVLKPATPLKPSVESKDGCYASVRGLPVKRLSVNPVGSMTVKIEGFDHGGSGAPIVKDGKVIGVCIAISGEFVKFVPMVLVMELLK